MNYETLVLKQNDHVLKLRLTIMTWDLAFHFVSIKVGVPVYLLQLTRPALLLMSPSFEKVIEFCAVQINVSDAHFIVIRIYRSPAGNFNQFINFLDAALKHLYKPIMEFLLCGDLNVNYLNDSNCKF